MVRSLNVLSMLWATAQATATTTAPTLSLPWGSYTATLLPNQKEPAATPDIFKFENVRFADVPTGSLRFASPVAPPTDTPRPTQSGAIKCSNVNLTSIKKGLGVPFFGLPEAGADKPDGTEDCLFLDVYAPVSLFKDGKATSNVPVIVWIYGGAYVAGSKNGDDPNNPLYSGVGALKAAQAFQENVIFVAGNYRLGAYGWLAGTYIEDNAVANVGLLDQQFLFKWVQSYIGQVGGDPGKISAWGESAGASSILHHLVLNGGTTDPIFNKALLQSPAYQQQWDRSGVLDDVFTNFSSLVTKCQPRDISCLRSLPLDDTSLYNANTNFVLSTYHNTGLLPLGPAVDGTLIEQLAINELVEGKIFKGLDSIIVSHVEDEAKIFLPTWATADANFTAIVSNFMPQASLSTVRDQIASQYPANAYPSTQARLNALIRDSSFTCNNWQLFQAYHDLIPTYMMWYDFEISVPLFGVVFQALHATDLAPTFWNDEVLFWKFLQEVAKRLNKNISNSTAEILANAYAVFSPHYQSYLVSHAIYGDPNKGSFQKFNWPTAITTVSGSVTQLANVQMAKATPPQFKTTIDTIVDVGACSFWQTVATKVDTASSAMRTPPPNVQQQVLQADRRSGLDELK